MCPEGYHNDLATLFLSNTHETIIALFGMGHDSAVQEYVGRVQLQWIVCVLLSKACPSASHLHAVTLLLLCGLISH